MKNWKPIASLLLALSLAGCGGGQKPAEAPAPAAEPAAVTETAPAAKELPPAEPESAPAETAEYAPVLNEVYEMLYNGYDNRIEYAYDVTGVVESAMGAERDERLDAVGWAVRDISGDGVPELLIGSMKDNSLYNGFTLKDHAPVMFLEGWGRNCYTWLGENRFFNLGSGGAAYAMFGTSHVSPDGTELVCEDYWFTYEKDGNYEDIRMYHNKTGAWDPAASEELDISDDAFWEIMNGLDAQSKPFGLTAFREYEYTGERPLMDKGQVRTDYLSDVAGELGEYENAADRFPERFPADGSYETTVVFRFDGEVRDFKLLSLTLRDVDERGNANFDTEEVFSLSEPRLPLAVPMSFPGDIPSSGYSYTDARGTTWRFTLSMSGMDGSLVTAPF